MTQERDSSPRWLRSILRDLDVPYTHWVIPVRQRVVGIQGISKAECIRRYAEELGVPATTKAVRAKAERLLKGTT